MLILVLTILPVVVFGKFRNEFLRINIIFASVIFTYFANEHYLIRMVASIVHVFVILCLDYQYLREYILQLACYSRGKTIYSSYADFQACAPAAPALTNCGFSGTISR